MLMVPLSVVLAAEPAVPDFLARARSTRWPAPAAPASGDFALVVAGKATASVAIDAGNQDLARAAAALADVVQRMSGVRLPVTEDAAGPTFRLTIDPTLPREGRRLRVTATSAVLAGADPWAVELGVYELLRRLGVRWYMPGELGRVVPVSQTVRLPAGVREWAPRYSIRDQTGPFWRDRFISKEARRETHEWHRRVGAVNSKLMTYHNYHRMFPAEMLAEHPEYFAVVEGRPTADQIRTTSEEVIRMTVDKAIASFRADPELRAFSLMPNDNINWDERPEATRLDGPEPLPNWIFGWPRSNVAPRLMAFVNAVAERVSREHPRKWLFTYVMYHRQQRPTPGLALHPNVMLGLVLHDNNCARGIADPDDERNRYEYATFRQWQAIMPRGIIRTYVPPFRLSAAPFRRPRANLRDMGLLSAQEKMLGFKNEYIGHWACHLPSVWVQSMWGLHPERPPEELLLDFYANFYGPARAPMMAYHELSEWTIVNSDLVVMPGSRVFARLAEIYPPNIVQRLGAHLAAAETAVASPGNDVYRDRVRLIAFAHDYLNKSLAASRARAEGHPEKALELIEEMRGVALEAWKFNRHAFQHSEDGKLYCPSLDWECKRLRKAVDPGGGG